MTIREQIIQRLDKEPTFGHYKQLKYSLVSNDIESIARVDMWFAGIIESLYYRPNRYVLVLEGNEKFGRSQFFRNLLPNQNEKVSDHYYEAWGNNNDIKELLYNHLIIQFDECMSKKDLNLPNEDNFKVNEDISKLHFEYESNEDFVNNLLTVHGFSSCDKRLASYCCTTNKWQFPQRKNYIILHLESINQKLFNSIDKELLWIEIFNKFKP